MYGSQNSIFICFSCRSFFWPPCTHAHFSVIVFLSQSCAHLPWPERSPRPPRGRRGAVCPPRRMKPNCQRTNYRIYPLFAIDKATYSRRSGLPENKLGAYITSERMIKIPGPHRAGPILDGQGDCFWRNRPVFTAPKQHAAQIRDCLVVDQTFRTERACYVEGNSFRLPEKGNYSACASAVHPLLRSPIGAVS